MEILQPGQMLGPYRIISQIGQGGMATIYKAYQPSMDRNVAIKVLPRQLAESEEFTKRFQQEARIIAKLEHPHILPVFDYGENDGIHYFVMRYFEGGSLQNRMQAGRPLPLQEIDRIFTQLAEALGYAHSMGVIHRDLKPSNALLDTHGNLFLTDFGISKLLENTATKLTQTDVILGTPAYISPEQAQSRPVDQRTDIYSLGIILYEMVAGRVPFVAETPLAVVLMHVSDRLPPPTSIKTDVPESVERVLLKALAKDPNDRFSTSNEFLAAWHQALEEAGTHITRHSSTNISSQPIPKIAAEPKSNTAGTMTPPPTPKPATTTMTSTASRRSSTGWLIGCVVIACLVFAVGGLGFGVLYTQGFFGQEPEPTSTFIPPTFTSVPPPEATPTVVVVDEPLFEDDFSTSAWGTGTDSDSSVEYENQALHFFVNKDFWYVWSTPNEENYEDIHIEVTAVNNSTDPKGSFGIICNLQNADDTSYYFAVTGSGDYAIGRYTLTDDILLTNDGEWAPSSAITPSADSYRVGVDCGNGILNLYVDGQLVDSVSDATFTSGNVGLFAWSDEKQNSTDVTFDDFVVTNLP